MKKPEKKALSEFNHCCEADTCVECIKDGYNQACDAWEKWLPDTKEIEKIIEQFEEDNKDWIKCSMFDIASNLAKAISERLGREK